MLTKSNVKPACFRCAFWDKVKREDHGICRRLAPANLTGDGWPTTGRVEWCGEFSPNAMYTATSSKSDADDVLCRRVDELELSVRSRNCLKNDNIVYLGDLIQKTEEDLMRTPNFGRVSLAEIKGELAKLGLRLASVLPATIRAAASLAEAPALKSGIRMIDFKQLKPQKGIGYSRDHLRRMVKAGKFPMPIPLSESRIAWVEAEIDDWLTSRAAQR